MKENEMDTTQDNAPEFMGYDADGFAVYRLKFEL